VKKFAFSLILIIATLIIARGFKPSNNPSEFDIDSFAELPVQVGGRIKPLDSVARNTLLVLAARQKVVTPEGVTLSPIEWFMDLTMRPEVADTYRVFKIEFPDDLGIAGLAQKGQRHYAFNDLLPHFDEILRLYKEINPEPKKRSPYEQQIADLNDGLTLYHRVMHSLHLRLYKEINPEPKKRSPYEQQIADLNDGLTLYHRVMHSLHPVGPPERLDRLVDEYQSYISSVEPGLVALRQQQAGEDYDAELLSRFIQFGDDYLKLSKTAYLRVVPPIAPVDPLDDWKNIGLELLDVMRGDDLSPYVTSYASLTMAYRMDQPDMFNQTVEQLRQRFIGAFPHDIGRVHFERLFNQAQPFYLSMQLYVLIFLTVCISWLRWPAPLAKAAFWVLLLAFTIHTLGLIARMYIQERYGVFVTNLYSSAVFVGWGAVLLGVILEKFYKNGVGAAMASLVGFCTLIIAHHLSMSGDTLEMMRAVLDSNFWLATHVTVITFGYSAMFFAGALALIFTVLGLFSKRFSKESAKSIVSMVYGITCFATLFSLVGTILGGIWADQSWGRFWGWDPKENGALMIVIMGAIVLHWVPSCYTRAGAGS